MGHRWPVRAIGVILVGFVAAVSGSQMAGTGSAARTPSWTGHWAAVLTCPYPNCGGTTGTLDLVQSGSTITGKITAADGSITPLSSGTASGFTATLTFVSSQFSIKLPVTMSADGASFSGQWIVTEHSSGISRTLGVTAHRAAGSSVKASVSASPSKITVPSASPVGGKIGKVTVTVAFTNTSRASAANLQLLSLTVVPVDRTKAPPKLGFPAASFPVHLGTLAPGAVLAKSFTLDVARGNGLYKVEALALFDDPTVQGGNGRAFGVGGQFQVIQQLAIEGTVVAAPSCANPSCPAKPLPGVTVTAKGPNGGQARTGFDGKYSIEASKGDYTVTATYRNKVFLPTSRSVTVDAATVSGVDFACVPIQKAGVTTACEAPEVHVLGVRVASDRIELSYQGTGWDPNGGPISLSFSANPVGQAAGRASFSSVLRFDRWPHRTSVPIAQARQNTNGYCWGELAARQGSSFASTGIVKGKIAGWVLWSADPSVHAQEAWCEGEDHTYFHTSTYPIILYDINLGIRDYNFYFPGSEGRINPFAPVVDLSFSRLNECIRLHATKGIMTITTSPGPCK